MPKNYGDKIKTKYIDKYSYSLNDVIGQGAYSTVYKGKNNQNQLILAIKVIDLTTIKKQYLKELLKSQICLLQKLNHFNVLKCQDIIRSTKNCYIITQYCQDGNLDTWITNKARLQPIYIKQLIVSIVKGLQYLKSINIVHRDIKPANILINKGSFKIADFGFGWNINSYQSQRYSIGTPAYMSPEALNGYYSFKSDIWSLGVLLYEVTQGKLPWDSQTRNQLKQQIKNPFRFRISLSQSLQQIIQGCLQYEEDNRIQLNQILDIVDKSLNNIDTI